MAVDTATTVVATVIAVATATVADTATGVVMAIADLLARMRVAATAADIPAAVPTVIAVEVTVTAEAASTAAALNVFSAAATFVCCTLKLANALLDSSPGKINVSVLHIRPDKFRSQSVPDVQPFCPLGQHAFNVRLHDANERSGRNYTGDDGVESLADAIAHHHRRQPLRHLALNFSRGVSFQGAVA